MKMPLAYSRVPMAPSHSTGPCWSREIRSNAIVGNRKTLVRTLLRMRGSSQRSAALLCYNQRFQQLIYWYLWESNRLKRAFVAILSGAAFLIFTSCGGGSSSSGGSTAPTTSGILKRALVTDRFNGITHIFDAAVDATRGNNISTGGGSSVLALMPDKKHTIVVASGNNSVSVIDNTTETVIANVVLPDFIDSIAVSSDNKTVYAALRNAPVSGQ